MKKTGPCTPEFSFPCPAPEPKPAERASEYITISVAEYHFLTKLATMLEVVLADKSYSHENVVAAVRNAVDEMTKVTTEITQEYDNGTVRKTVVEE